MKIRFASLLLMALAFGASACGPGEEPTDGGGTPEDMDSGMPDEPDLPTIPDPGDETAPDRWFDDGAYHGTPETAQEMGIVFSDPDYVQGGIDPETMHHYFVFRTGPDVESFQVNLNDASSEIEEVHIHLGTGLVLGEMIEPAVVNSATSLAWRLLPDTIYVLEVFSPTGGFFF